MEYDSKQLACESRHERKLRIESVTAMEKEFHLITEEYVQSVIRKREPVAHKGDFGKILIVAGSETMTGAAVLAAKSALKAGSGLVKVCIPDKLFPVIQICVPEAICTTWGDVKNDLDSFDAIAVGPGMGTGIGSRDIIKKILLGYDGPLIIDADGLNTIADPKNGITTDMVRNSEAQKIMTPHWGEAARLLQPLDLNDIKRGRAAEILTEKFRSVIVLKGEGTLVAITQQDISINNTGNPGMATAGSGDCLTGIITSFAGQGMGVPAAARAGVYIHGLAGDIAAEELGEYGMTAGDIAGHVPYAIKQFCPFSRSK